MADTVSDEVSVVSDLRQLCGLCHFPSWSKETSSDDYEISLKSFAGVSASAEKGCNGCKLVLHVWEYTVPDVSGRENSRFNFNRSKEELWVHIFADGGVHNIELFTLHGK
jgi:hypothetical protein